MESIDWPKISVVVLNYNGERHLQDCFASLFALDYPAERCELIFVDNASSDGSVEFMVEHFPTVLILRNEENLGFAEGNNRGAAMAQGEYVAFLNNDTRVDRRWLRELVEAVRRHRGIDCVASRMLSWDGRSIDFADSSMNFIGWGSQLGFGNRRPNAFRRDKELLFACGGAMFIKREVFLHVGGFDPDFFAYYEDADLGWRLWVMGYRTILAGRAVVFHRHHGTWDQVNDAQRWVLFERNTLSSVFKNYDNENLARVFPAALLLLAQRVYLDINPDALTVSNLITPAVLPPRNHSRGRRARELLHQRAYGRLLRGALNLAKQYWHDLVHPRSRPLPRPYRRAIGNQIDVPALAISRLIAGRELLDAFPALMHKRQKIQETRRRTDCQIFPLFRSALTSNFDDEQFIDAMEQVSARLGVTEIFDGKGNHPLPDGLVTTLSRQVSLALLELMNQVLECSGVPTSSFRLHAPPPSAESRIPLKSLSILAELNLLLWSLPEGSMEQVLAWLAAGCQRILNSTR